MAREAARLREADAATVAWREWGPYLSERAWGTVREDYSDFGTAWDYLPHDHARSRAYRWSEDGLAGVCDKAQTFCFAFAFWNGEDPILKERIFGLAGPEGNHGEDAKEYWWYTDSTPTHSWMSWRYHYPQRAFPYAELVSVNGARGRSEPEFELVDTGIFDDDRYWAVTVDYAKAGPEDMLVVATVENRGPDAATLHVLPTLWFRNTWAWGLPGSDAVPSIRANGTGLEAQHPTYGRITLAAEPGAEALFCDNETNTQRLYGAAGRSRFPKDAINDHVVAGAATVNPDGHGTKAALHYRLHVPSGESRQLRLRIVKDAVVDVDLGEGFAAEVTARKREADEFFADLTPAGTGPDETNVLRQALAGLMWGKQFFNFDVARWLDGDPAGPPPSDLRRHGRNSDWRHLNNADVISMPDPWEYPWYASWDLAFHCVPLAHIDPTFAKEQLILMLREWYMHPNGQIPGYEWAFGDVNPPVHAWAALRVFEIDGCRDHQFLARVFHKLLINFTWWVNRKDSAGNNVFQGGFLGLDNIGPIDRSAMLPVAGRIEQSDGTAWMATYALNLLEIALVLAANDPTYEDAATKFFEHFAYIAQALRDQGLWNEEDGFFYDVLALDDGSRIPLKVRSMVGLLPLTSAVTLGAATLAGLPDFASRFQWFLDNRPEFRDVVGATHVRDGAEGRLLSVVDAERLVRILDAMLDEEEFLSPHGLRALSRRHRADPFEVELDGMHFRVGYEPGESSTGLFGGNSNWRGPVWFPVNYLIVEALRRYGRFYGTDLVVEYPTGSGVQLTLDEVADALSRRLVGVFLDDESGRRPVFGDAELFQRDRGWHDLIPFHEYFNGDSGAGVGASHQTGWTALVADLIIDQRRSVTPAAGSGSA
jgi:hypothetical protein